MYRGEGSGRSWYHHGSPASRATGGRARIGGGGRYACASGSQTPLPLPLPPSSSSYEGGEVYRHRHEEQQQQQHDRGREGRLGLEGLDHGFVAGGRPPRPYSDSDHFYFARTNQCRPRDKLTSFDRLGFGQDQARIVTCLDRDEHEQAHHPLVHRHAPLGGPRRLGSGPEHFERALWDATCAKFHGNNGQLNNERGRNFIFRGRNNCASARGFREYYNNCNYSSQRRADNDCSSSALLCGSRRSYSPPLRSDPNCKCPPGQEGSCKAGNSYRSRHSPGWAPPNAYPCPDRDFDRRSIC